MTAARRRNWRSTPFGVLANGPFSLTVNAEDPFGNVDPTFNGSVTLTLASNPGSATLGGTLTVHAVMGWHLSLA